ncbi:MAG: flavin reductase family protein [Geodermatophilaceae bacterium]|nr:flavin reductase family protein [Geodermatophilaceae bacterium]
MPLGPPDERAFRKTMGRFPTGVAVVTTQAGVPRAVTASAFAAVSAQPPLVLVCVNTGALSLDPPCHFAVSVLARHQQDLAVRFRERGHAVSSQAFEHVAWWTARVSGAPVLSGTVAWFDCAVHDVLSAGERTVVIGRVLDLGHIGAEPLVRLNGVHRGLDHPTSPPLLPSAVHVSAGSLVGHN